MNYIEIRNLLKKHSIELVDLDIVSCVMASSYNLSDEEFNLICDYVYRVWDNVDKTYTQLISDVVCDLYQDNLGYGYRNEEDERFLTRQDLKTFEKLDVVIDLFYDRYYD